MGYLGCAFVRQACTSGLSVGLGHWRLYGATDVAAPAPYALLVADAAGGRVLVWLAAFPDLLSWLARYGNVARG
jgi:hypothetical protein